MWRYDCGKRIADSSNLINPSELEGRTWDISTVNIFMLGLFGKFEDQWAEIPIFWDDGKGFCDPQSSNWFLQMVDNLLLYLKKTRGADFSSKRTQPRACHPWARAGCDLPSLSPRRGNRWSCKHVKFREVFVVFCAPRSKNIQKS